MSASNMEFAVIDRLFIVVYGTGAPSDEEWGRYLQAVEQHGIDRTMQIVVTEGGGPLATQRRYLNELMKGRSVPVAVVSGSRVIRGVVTGLSWFNRRIRAFPRTGMRDALAYLEIPTSRADLIEGEVAKLRRALGRGVEPGPKNALG